MRSDIDYRADDEQNGVDIPQGLPDESQWKPVKHNRSKIKENIWPENGPANRIPPLDFLDVFDPIAKGAPDEIDKPAKPQRPGFSTQKEDYAHHECQDAEGIHKWAIANGECEVPFSQ